MKAKTRRKGGEIVPPGRARGKLPPLRPLLPFDPKRCSACGGPALAEGADHIHQAVVDGVEIVFVCDHCYHSDERFKEVRGET